MYKKLYKRIFDVIFSILLLIIVIPVILIISILIKLNSKGPVFFKQDRIGKDGKTFEILKFRTMVVGAEKLGTGILIKSSTDNRITKVGSFLRKISLDELPQLINVIKGEMSLVGPRPPATYYPYNGYENYPEWAKKRFIVLPGITGLAQVVYRSSVGWDDRIKLDVKYIDTVNFIVDIKLIAATVFKVVKQEDIYRECSLNKKKNIEKDGMLVIYPFIKRKAGIVDGIQYFDLVTPRGECGPWIEKCDASKIKVLVDAFNEEFNEYCIQENIVAEYIRFNPWRNDCKHFSSIYDIGFYGYVYCNNIMHDFFKVEYGSRVKKAIKKAKKYGVKISFNKGSNSIEDFLNIYDFTAKKYKISNYYALDKSILKKYCETFPDETVFVKAVYKGEITSMLVMLLGEDIVHYHLAGSNPEYNYLQGNSLMMYEAALYAAQKGKKLFDFGIVTLGSSVETFKINFIDRSGKHSVALGTKVRNKEIYYTLVEQAGEVRKGYFPAYRFPVYR